jgi:raffinose/stachyose/melibiose transport system substrate-binding protein
MYKKLVQCVAGAALGFCALAASAGTLTIESWRIDDKDLWEGVLIPAFEKSHPGIKVKFTPTAPTEYDATLNSRLAGGTAGDLITCRPFDVSLGLYKQKHLEQLNGKPGMEAFPASAKVAWQTDDGQYVFCMPMASVIHGFFYNKKIFSELGLQPPKTVDEFFKVAEAIKKSGKYTPIALGTADQWESHQIVYTGIGPNYWRGEQGRQALVLTKVLESQGKKGKKRFTDPEFVKTWEQMAKWGPYMGKGYQSQTYGDSQNLFALGKAAIYPAGSWDISHFNKNANFEFGAFYPPVPKTGDKCYISDHTDIAMGINSKAKNKADAYKFLKWMSSAEFADLYTNRVTGFFSLSKHAIEVKDPVAKEMIGWRKSCASTIRLNAQILNRGQPPLENEFWVVDSQVLNGQLSPQDAAKRIEAVFSKN